MTKYAVFNDSTEDKSLVEQIMQYQKAHGLPSFISAVRKLCRDALAVAKITH